MDKRIIYKMENNGVAVLCPTNSWTGTLEELAAKDIPADADWKIVNLSEVPTDRTFRSAWEYNNGLTVNVDKAKEIQKDKWRAARKPVLEKLDIDFMKAVETMDTNTIQTIAQQKQALRDVTNTSLPDDLEGIKNTWPEILNG